MNNIYPMIKVTWYDNSFHNDGMKISHSEYPVKHTAEFTMQSFYPSNKHAGSGHWYKWGDFAYNFWFTSASGKSVKCAVANAVKRLKTFTKSFNNVNIEVLYK